MRQTYLIFAAIIVSTLFFSACSNVQKPNTTKEISVRKPVDTVGFAQYDWQMDSIMARVEREQGKVLREKLAYSEIDGSGWKVAVSPHDDYSYVGYMYPAVLKNIKAST